MTMVQKIKKLEDRVNYLEGRLTALSSDAVKLRLSEAIEKLSASVDQLRYGGRWR